MTTKYRITVYRAPGWATWITSQLEPSVHTPDRWWSDVTLGSERLYLGCGANPWQARKDAERWIEKDRQQRIRRLLAHETQGSTDA